MAISVDMFVNDAIKVGITSLIVSRIAKTIGQKDMSEIIEGTGIAIVGFDLIGIFLPAASSISKFFDKISGMADKIELIIQNFDKGGLLNQIINFGGKKW